MVGTGRFELPACRLGGDRSIHLSYVPTQLSLTCIAVGYNWKKMTHLLKSILILVVLAFGVFSQETMNNEGILKLVKSGMSEDLIVSVIRHQPGIYVLGANELVTLKEAGVSERLITEMLDKGKGDASPQSSPTPKPVVAAPKAMVPGPGLFYKKNGEYFELITEDVEWKTSGAMNNILSAGIVKKDLNGELAGPSSRNFLTNPIEIVISTAKGLTVNSYILLPLKLEDGARSFKVGPVNKKSGVAKGAIAFGAEKLGENMFRMVIPTALGPGEYGILAAVPSDATTTTSKMFTFRILI